MDKKACKEHFYHLVYPSLPNEWEVDDIMDRLAQLEEAQQQTLFSKIPAIWPISHSLCLSFLEEGSEVVGLIPADLVPQWVRTILRSYEKDGLVLARRYISQVEEKFLQPLKTHNRVRFEVISARMLYYIRGVSGQHIDIEKESIAHTDTSTLYVPQEISLLPHFEQNQLIYKFLLSLHWGFIRRGTFAALPTEQDFQRLNKKSPAPRELKGQRSVAHYLCLFDDAELAADLFFLLETGCVMAWIRQDLTGLAKQFDELQTELSHILRQEKQNALSQRVEELAHFQLFGIKGTYEWDKVLYATFSLNQMTTGAIISHLPEVYDHLVHLPGTYVRPPLMNLLGKHDFNRTAIEIEKKRHQTKEEFIFQLLRLQKSLQDKQEQETETGSESSSSADQSLILLTDGTNEDDALRNMITLDNPNGELPEELVSLIKEIQDDLGDIPKSYFSAASGIAGRGVTQNAEAGPSAEENRNGSNCIHFDEWDYRRNGYRKRWCQLYEKQLPVLQSTFVSSTLEKHRGLLLKLRRQFELMRTSERFVRRQREGDDLDLDAIVEARGDQRAGISPSDKLFVRLHRNERDIATVFLIDMSNSTEGWVGNVIKEALVLLCEVMDIAGDPYGILGFSGMRRSRCEIFTIKDVDEPYTHTIHQRINSMMPREYTRMGPAIRYATHYLRQCEARTRLLVTITDGKPEDYDDYKGEYAIEDTRKALMETRGCGMHAFCITVDREAHDYLPQMFGSGNYIFVDDIDKLPVKMVDMYRLLTA
ncbi:MAG: VWA domain-containing protein [Deltaproteobacteria bacterium]|nr:VWA domain-containing protein [Deltaproteobacteria bacterium]